MRPWLGFLAAWLLATAVCSPDRCLGQDDSSAKLALDLHGDPLPPGAIARLGCGRLLQPGGASGVCFSPDGKLLVTYGHSPLVHVWDRHDGKLIKSLSVPDSIYSAAFSPDGVTLAMGGDALLATWDAKSGEVELRRQWRVHPTEMAERRIYSLAYSPDGLTIACGSVDGFVRLVDAASGEELLALRMKEPRGVLSVGLAYSPDGESLAAGMASTIHVWNLATGAEPRLIPKAHGEFIHSLAFSADGESLFSSGGSPAERGVWSIRAWNVESLAFETELFSGETNTSMAALALAADGRTLASIHPRAIRLWDVASRREIRAIEEFENRYGPSSHKIAVSPDSRTVAAIADGNKVRLWDIDSGREQLALPDAHRDGVLSVAFTPDGRQAVTCGNDGTVRLWDFASGRHVRKLYENPGCIREAVVLADGKTVLVVGERHHRTPPYFDGVAAVIDLSSGRTLREWRLEHRCFAAAGSPDGTLIAIATGFGLDEPGEPGPVVVHVWESGKSAPLVQLRGHTMRIERIAFSPDGKTLSSVSQLDDTIRTWDIASGKELYSISPQGHRRRRGTPDERQDGFSRAAFAPDGRFVFTMNYSDAILFRWDLGSGKEVSRFDRREKREQQRGGVFAEIAVSPDARLLACTYREAADDLGIVLFDAASGRELGRFAHGTEGVLCLAFSPDGARLVSGMESGTALVWDLSAIKEPSP